MNINDLLIMYSCLSDSDTETIQNVHSTDFKETKSSRNKIGFEANECKGWLKTTICVNFHTFFFFLLT